MSATLVYVYCLVRSGRAPLRRAAPRGIPGAGPIRALELPSLTARGTKDPGARHWLIVSDVPERLYGEAPLERGLASLEWIGPRALAHEAVVEHFLGAAAVLPMQLFTLFTSDARAIEHVAADRRRLQRILARIARQTEWGLRITWDPESGDLPRSRKAAGGTPRARSGTDYLTGKRDEREAARARLQRARADAARVYRAMRAEATDARRRPEVERAAPGSRVLLDAAFLVPAARSRVFQAAVQRHARGLKRAGAEVALTGPWPAYNFI